MADEYSDFQSVTSGEVPGTVENELPNEEGATAFQYRKWIDSFVPFSAIDIVGGGLGSAVVTGEWKIQLLSGPNGAVLFEQTVELRFNVIVSIVSGQVGFFFWSPIDGGNGLIETTIVGGADVPFSNEGKREGWRFVDTPTPTPLSEFGDTQFDINDTGNYTDDGGFIRATYYAPRYIMDVPVGAVLNVVHDRWQVGVMRESSYQFSFKLGELFASLVDKVRALRTGVSDSGGLLSRVTYKGGADHVTRARLGQASSPCEWKDETNRMWRACFLGPTEKRSYTLFWSDDDARSWTRLTYKNEDGEELPVEIWPEGYSSPFTIGLPNGGGASVAISDNKIYVKVTSDKKIWPGANEVRLEDGTLFVPDGKYQLQPDGDGLLLTNNKDHVLLSDKNGRKWKRL